MNENISKNCTAIYFVVLNCARPIFILKRWAIKKICLSETDLTSEESVQAVEAENHLEALYCVRPNEWCQKGGVHVQNCKANPADKTRKWDNCDD